MPTETTPAETRGSFIAAHIRKRARACTESGNVIMAEEFNGYAEVVEDQQAEIERLSRELQEAKKLEALVREYISERDAPAPDLGYRAHLLNRIRSVLSPKPESEKDSDNDP